MKIAARFTATPINPFAPAIVHLDASATTAEGVARPFHELEFRWYVARAGDFRTDLVVSDAPIAAVVLDEPGRYAIILRAAHADGSAAHAYQWLDVTVPHRVVELEPGSRHASVALPAGGGLLKTRGFPADVPAIVTGTLSPPDGWTIQGVDFEGGGVALAPGRSRIALIDLEMRDVRNGGLVSMTGGETARHSDLIGLAGCTITGQVDSRMPDVFLRAERIVILDCVLDGGGTYNLRTVHFPRMALSLTHIESLAPGANALQLRAWGGEGAPNTPSDYWAVSDCMFTCREPSTAVVRTCQTNTCDDTGPGVVTAADVRHGLFRNCVLVVSGTVAPPPAIGFWIQGGDITIKGCELDAGRVSMAGAGTTRFVQQRPDSARRAGLAHDRLWVVGNRIRLPRGNRGVAELEAPLGVGHVARENTIERV